MADLLDELDDPSPAQAGPVTYRSFHDIPAQRKAIYDAAVTGVSKRFPIENQTHRLELAGVGYGEDKDPTRADEKKALLEGGRLHRPLTGELRLVDKASGRVLDRRSGILAHVPHLNSRGLFIHNGTPWAMRNQQRLQSGVYVRKQSNGGTEAHFNVAGGRGFRVNLEPDSGLFKVQIGQSTTRLYPVLKALGASDEQLKEAWGPELFKKNWREHSGHDVSDLRKMVSKLGRGEEVNAPDHKLAETLHSILGRGKLDPDVTEMTLGARHEHPTHDVILAATKKALRVANGEKGDTRDSLAFQSFHAPEDFIQERLARDQVGAARDLLWKATKSGNLESFKSGMLTPNIHALFRGSGLTHALEDISPYESHDLRQAVTRLGEGGINSTQSVSRDARGIQPTYFGVIDSSRAPESSNVGLDMRLADGAYRGSDGKLYARLHDRNGKPQMLTPAQMTRKVVAFPGELAKNRKMVRAMVGEQMKYVNRNKVDYELPHASDMFASVTNMVPLMEGAKPQRILMGARMLGQSMPLREAEAPLVHSVTPEGNSYYEDMGRHAGAVHADKPGVVTSVTPDEIHVLHPGGEKTVHQLYNNYPMARKTSLHNTAVVKAGDKVGPGQLLAHSNYTDKNGVAAPGLNLRTGYLSGHGGTFEDAIVISESAAKRLSSEHQYKHELELDKTIHSTKTADHRALYDGKFTPEQYANLDDEGAIKVGTVVNKGDPLLVGIGNKSERARGALMNTSKSSHTDLSQVWDHEQPGVVTDVARTRKGVKVTTKSYEPMTVGSKASNLYGGKGVISKIVPDDQMPHDEDGRPLELLQSPTGILTRANPAVLAATILGKVAAKRGQPYKIKSFSTPDGLADFALNEASKHGVKETETLTDPATGRKIPNVFTGSQYFLKLHHTAESKIGARDVGGYSVDDSPAGGGYSGSKRIGLLDLASLMSYGATEFAKDAKLIRGQRNDDYWRAVKQGETPVAPRESFANKHFQDLLRAAGASIKDTKHNTQQLGYLTDSDIDEMAQHHVTNSGTFDFQTMNPVKDGLFDLGKTGGAEGTRFAKIALPAKIPNPIAQEPIVRMLGLTNAKFEDVLAGREKIGDKTGPDAIEHALKNLNVDREIERAKQTISAGSGAARDSAVRALGYLTGIKKQGIKPEELMLSKMPVLPPKYRPILRARGVDMIHDANYLYHDLLEAGKNYSEHNKEFGTAGDQYLNMYKAAKAVSGLGDPVNPKHVEQGVKGMLRFAIGVKDSPKYSRFQRKVLGNSVDTVGRSVITIDPDLDMDTIGMPEEMAKTQFRPFVIGHLVRQGLSATEATKAVRDSSPAAMHALDEVMKEHPVVYNRAPSLHRYNYVGAMAKINRGQSNISIPQSVTKGLGADFDGDAINVHVPASEAAIREVKEKLFPSKNLLHPGTFDVHLEPTQEFLAGLYLASQRDEKKAPRVFATAEDAKRAYARGEIGVRDPIEIAGS